MLLDLKPQVKELTDRLEMLRGIFDLEALKSQLAECADKMSKPDFWDNPQNAQAASQEHKRLSEKLSDWTSLSGRCRDVNDLLDLALEEGDESQLADIGSEFSALAADLDQYEIRRTLSEFNDHCNAIMDIHAGAGGTEAQDWAQMLLRMYLMYADANNFKTQIIDSLDGDEAGLKSVTLTVSGPYAYGLLRTEVGIHRLVRISPFDSQSRRHTSFASVFVTPEVDDDIVIEINDKDLRIDTYRASGSGGQHVNKTSSAVRITHLPTNIVVQCQDEKSQHRNKDVAMKVLRARLYQLEESKKAAEVKKMHDNKKEIGWGSQIRSYTLQPYRLIKDHRTGYQSGNVDNVLAGDISGFIKAYLLDQAALVDKAG
ncbi:MAG: peptide chain release factor 2 [Deltaproteobacteria bacterium]|nr:peptide chain release factor 2 [Deltaproteobacteria bacterium]